MVFRFVGVVLFLVACTVVLADNNGMARTPPMGWRSWNAFYTSINSSIIAAQVDELVQTRDATGKPDQSSNESLLSLGFSSIGIDEGWEGCGKGVNKTVHYINGTPTVGDNFPDMPALVAYGHKKGAKMGFYLNGCGCNEKVAKEVNYAGDVQATVAWGFDSVKIDSCGAQTNMTLYNQLFNASSRAMQVENCHQGRNIPDGGNPDQMGPGWCPYNIFRTSGDITNLWDRVMSNLLTVVPFLTNKSDTMNPLSRPGCWSYPDMLEVGRMSEHNAAESRSHFAAWAIVSAPLTLGFDLTRKDQMAQAWPIVSNREVIEISQSWVKGRPFPSGRLVKTWQAPNKPTIVTRGSCSKTPLCVDKVANCTLWAKQNQCLLNKGFMLNNCQKSCDSCPGVGPSFQAWKFDQSTGELSAGGLCLDAAGQLPPAVNTVNVMHLKPCSGASSQKWSFNGTNGQIKASSNGQCLGTVYTWLWNYETVVAMGGCNTAASSWTLHPNGTLSNEKHGCVEISTRAGPPSTIWTKPLSGNRTAVLVINGADSPQEVELDLNEVTGEDGMAFDTRDVWKGEDVGQKQAVRATLAPHDCMLLAIAPAN